MSRVYVVTFSNAVTVAQDLAALVATANMALEVVSFGVGPDTTTVENLRLNLKRLTATLSAGSGGSAATPVPDRSSDAAATVTARVNDTTQMTTSGGTVFLHRTSINLVNGYEWIYHERVRPIVKPGEGLVLELATAPAASRTLYGWLKFRELF